MTTRMRDTVLKWLLDSGIDTIFGNPGTTELPLMDALVDAPEMKYILTLHDSIAVGMAHGYTLSSKRPAVVNLHAAPGVHNAMGNLYNAHKAGVPLLVTAGQVDTRHAFFEPPLWGDLVDRVRGCTKWAYEVHRSEHLLPAFRRALTVATTPPTGPVFLSLPMDVLDAPDGAEGRAEIEPFTPVFGGQIPDKTAVRRIADLLTGARRPVIVAGDEVGKGEAVPDLIRLSEGAAIPVFAERVPGTMVFPTDHPCYRGAIGSGGEEIAQNLADADVLILVGAGRLVPVVYSEKWRLPEAAQIVHMGADPWEVGKNFPICVGVTADVAATLAAISDAVTVEISGNKALWERVEERRRMLKAAHQRQEQALQASLESVWDQAPISVPRLVAEMRRLLPDDAIVVDESLTSTRAFHRFYPLRQPGTFFGIKGTALGLGLPASIGVKLAYPDRTVVCLIGDGSSLYAIQALWTAARYGVRVIVVVCNNRSYRILKEGMRAYRNEAGERENRPYPAMDLDMPPIDFPGLAQSFGVSATRVVDPGDLSSALRQALERAPFLVDVAVETGDL